MDTSDRSALETLLKYNWQVPRYTSYPPATAFTQKSDQAGILDLIVQSNRVGPRQISFYFHVPFCPKRCLFCGCHTEIGRPGSFIRGYMETLEHELALLLPMLDRNRPVTQVHFGGGTPNAVPYAYLERLLRKLESETGLRADAEKAIECDPNLLTPEKIAELGRIGFNRLSIGIQDFDPKVLQAVNRRFPKLAPKEIFRIARGAGFAGSNLDLIYGLPHQTRDSFRLAIEKAIDADPDRISLFPYAHVPWIKGHQSALQALPMPGTEERLRIAWESRAALIAAGFTAIGMDHFAKPDDELAIAAGSGKLHRNFQGYCSKDRAGQVYAMGASGIGQLHTGYYQNAKELQRYATAVEAGHLPVENAYRMRPEDIAVRAVINALLCDGEVRLRERLGEGLSMDWTAAYIEDGLARLAPLAADGLVEVSGDRIRLTERGHWVSRAVASVFDPSLQRADASESGPRFSKAI